MFTVKSLPADRSQDYAAFVRVVGADAKQTLAPETSAPIAVAAVAPDVSAAELNRQGYDALQAENYAQAVALLERVVELEPKNKVAWNNLGLAHEGLRDLEAAIVASQADRGESLRRLRLQQPRAPYARQQKFAEAEAAFLKQPLDRRVRGAAGSAIRCRDRPVRQR